ncbi:2-haloacid dehalogenase [Hymenobacter gelipurpurascens]|uniref:2-haloacid dehalogenase n=1 Tax=Hymenobacter gelipurpurascens TaxID=89968 RepID=A0A212UCR4_9BACT|nr:HAD family phosphatase [Hymenobacter gelipurpurascens]SNC75983.1 2-haloacid dehalogenase [Hymenobacter gelipurpurascens]
MASSAITTIVFDLGGVLIDWNPRYLYRKLMADEQQMETFLSTITTPDWNEEQDAGRTLAEATAQLVGQYPEHRELIEHFYGRWPEMLGGAIQGTVDILTELRNSGRYRLYALTNWSEETFPVALEQFEFLHWFEAIVVSGTEKSRKPFPGFYHTLLTRYQLEPGQAVFIDDNERNILAAKAIGFQTVHFQSPEQLRAELEALQVVA